LKKLDKSSILNWLSLFLTIISSTLIVSFQGLQIGFVLATLNLFVILISEKFLRTEIKYKAFASIPILVLIGIIILHKLALI